MCFKIWFASRTGNISKESIVARQELIGVHTLFSCKTSLVGVGRIYPNIYLPVRGPRVCISEKFTVPKWRMGKLSLAAFVSAEYFVKIHIRAYFSVICKPTHTHTHVLTRRAHTCFLRTCRYYEYRTQHKPYRECWIFTKPFSCSSPGCLVYGMLD